jgi:hypothetical protein
VALLYDDSRAPLVVVTSTGESSNEDYDAYLERLTALVRRRQRYAIVFDARRSARPTPRQRQKQADWMQANSSAIRSYNVGIAFVIDSAIVRGALTAILWLQETPSPHKVFASLDGAEQWVSGLLAKEGLRVPPAHASRSG